MLSVGASDADIFAELQEQIEKLTSHLDLLEPFLRVTEALKVLSRQDKRFQ